MEASWQRKGVAYVSAHVPIARIYRIRLFQHVPGDLSVSPLLGDVFNRPGACLQALDCSQVQLAQPELT